MSHLRQHKTFSDIEADIKRFYDDGTVDSIDTALKVAGRALGWLASVHGGQKVTDAKQLVFDAILERAK